jgi:hypothetical protein
MIFENVNEVDLVNKLLAVVGAELPNEEIMTKDEFNVVTDILRKSSAAFINRQDRDTQV